MPIKYRYVDGNQIIESLTIPEGFQYETIEYTENIPDFFESHFISMDFGKKLASRMALELGARAKQLRIENGLNMGSSLIDINSKLEKYLNLGALYPDALSEISLIVDSGQVDNFLPIYASAVLQIEDFLNA